MDEAGFVLALAGLISDPMCSVEIEQIVPEGHWRELVGAAMQSSGVKRAARLAAGLRGDEVPLKTRNTRLRSIFCSIVTENQQVPPPVYWPPAQLRLERDSLFPTTNKEAGSAIKTLFKDFLGEAAALRKVYEGADESLLSVFIENLMLLMQRYLWSVPCAYESLSDVSLYDHSRMTAALAALGEQDALFGGRRYFRRAGFHLHDQCRRRGQRPARSFLLPAIAERNPTSFDS